MDHIMMTNTIANDVGMTQVCSSQTNQSLFYKTFYEKVRILQWKI